VPDTTAETFLELVAARRGHFTLESGYHGGLWLDLDALFTDPHRVAPFVSVLAGALRSHDVAVVCGPLLGGAFLAQLVAQALGIAFCFTEPQRAPDSRALYSARYTLPASLAARVRGKRVAIVDDVMSAGSSMRATCTELEAHEAEPVVAGALLVLGTRGVDLFAERGIPVESVCRQQYDLWLPSACPLCAAGAPLEQPR
jgi:orotate phosphoribosyltransferase